jgi:tetratricopeptide (TPR) repeat protein
MNQGDHNASRAAAEESIRLSREYNDTATLADALGSLGHCALYAGDPITAEEAAKEGIEISERSGFDRELIWSLDAMAHINYVKGNFEGVEIYYARIGDVLKKKGAEMDPVYISGFLIEKAVRQGNMEEAEKLMRSTLEIITERRDSYMLATMQSMFAHALRQTGDLDKATFYYQKTIRLWQDRGHRAAIAHQLECFGLIALAQEHIERGVKLFSAADHLRNISNSVRTPVEQKEFDESKTKLQSQMNESEFNKEWSNGQSMTMEEAIELALEESK